MTTLKEKLEAKLRFDVTESDKRSVEYANTDPLIDIEIAFVQGARWQHEQLKSELLPILLDCVEALEFYTQARMIYEPGNTRQCEITHESDYQFYPNHDVALEALERLRKWSEGEKT